MVPYSGVHGAYVIGEPADKYLRDPELIAKGVISAAGSRVGAQTRRPVDQSALGSGHIDDERPMTDTRRKIGDDVILLGNFDP